VDVTQILQGVIDTTLCYRYNNKRNGGKSQERQAVRARGSEWECEREGCSGSGFLFL